MSDITLTEQTTSLTLQVTENEVTVVEQGVISLSLVCEETSLDIVCEETTLDIEKEIVTAIELITAGPIGPQGPPGADADSDTRVIAEAVETISALKIVRSVNSTQVALADSTGTFVEARCLGIALTAIPVGNTGTIQFFGAVDDASFTFAAGEPLFLTQDGNISNIQDPLSVYNSTIGHSLGAGSIFIDIREPIEL